MSVCPRGLPRKAGSGIFVSSVHVLASCSGRGSQKLACPSSSSVRRHAGRRRSAPGKGEGGTKGGSRMLVGGSFFKTCLHSWLWRWPMTKAPALINLEKREVIVPQSSDQGP
jgi:hypothetical protein